MIASSNSDRRLLLSSRKSAERASALRLSRLATLACRSWPQHTVGSNHLGCLTLVTSSGTFTTRLSVGGISSYVATQGRLVEYWNPLVRKWLTWPNTVFDDGECYVDWCCKLGMRIRLVCEKRKGNEVRIQTRCTANPQEDIKALGNKSVVSERLFQVPVRATEPSSSTKRIRGWVSVTSSCSHD